MTDVPEIPDDLHLTRLVDREPLIRHLVEEHGFTRPPIESDPRSYLLRLHAGAHKEPSSDHHHHHHHQGDPE